MRQSVWSRLRLAPRIAVMIALTLAASVGLETLLRTTVPRPVVLILEKGKVVEALNRMRLSTTPGQPPQIESALVGFGAAVVSSRPQPSDWDAPHFVALHAYLVEKLGLPREDVVLAADSAYSVSRSVHPLVLLFDTLPAVINFGGEYNTQLPVFTDFRIGLKTPSGVWLVVEPLRDGRETVRIVRNVLYMVGGLLLIGVLSVWVARSITRPLSDLADAAERMGRDRQPTMLGEFSMPELQAIAQTFNDMQLRLKRFVDDRLHMLAAISHDLRTPLTRLRLFAEYLEDGEQRRNLLSDIEDMETMISSTLTFAGSQLQSEAKAPVDLAAMLISICDNAADSGFPATYVGPDHALLTCQPLALRRAMVNLIDNARKYADRATVTLTETAHALVVEVGDDGPGIPAEQVELAFQPFVRLEGSRNRETGGAGLGLAITRDTVHAHGGAITLSAARPSGLLVTVTLPRPGV